MNKPMTFLAALAISCTAQGELLFDPTEPTTAGQMEAGALFGSSTTKYKASSDTANHDRTYMSVYGAYGVRDGLDAIGAVSMVTRSKPEGADRDGDGTQLALALRAKMAVGAVDVLGYTQLRTLSEENSGAKLKGNELSLGLLAVTEIGSIALFGGPEIIAVDNLESEVSGQSIDIDRDNTLGLRAGARAKVSGFNIVGQLAANHESSFQLGINKGF